MKWLLLLVLAAPAAAQNAVQNVHEVALTTNTVVQSTYTCVTNIAVNVNARVSSGTLQGAFATEIYNWATSTNTINCGLDPMVSTSAFSAWYGREIPPGVGVYWAVPPSNRPVYCLTQNATGCTYFTVTQFK